MNMNYMNMNMNMILIIIIFFYHLLLMTTIPTAFSDTTGDKDIVLYCPSNVTLNPDYSQSRNDLLEDLRVNTSKNKGFWITTSANDIKVYGLALCRGNLSSKHCETCLDNVTKELNSSCTNSTEAIVYHDHCLMKYSDKHFFGRTQNGSVFSKPDFSSQPGDSSSFNATTMGLFNNLVTEAAPNGKETDPLFAYGQNTTAAGNVTVYAMVQCSNDIWLDCGACLNNAIANVPKLYIPIGVRVLYGWTCVLRYEIYPFIEEKK